MTKQELLCEVQETVEAFYAEGGTIEINYCLPTIFILQPDGSEYFFQEHEAEELLDKTPRGMSEEDYIIWVSQGW